MSSRREFLTTMAAGLGASTLGLRWAAGADAKTIKSPLSGPIGRTLSRGLRHLAEGLCRTCGRRQLRARQRQL